METGPKKTPDGYYLIFVEGPPEVLEKAEELARLEGARTELAGDKLFIKVKSRRLRDKIYRRMKRSFAEALRR